MPEVTISIGSRQFEVACQEGEESYLHAAAKMLDDEAQVLSDQVGRMPEARMLLMAGLLLADKTASFEDQLGEVRKELAEREAELEKLRNTVVEPERIEVPVVPQAVTDGLAEMAARAESLAQEVEDRVAS
ncbi:cell division protein ZapA [Sulfitobacter sp. CW3]|jgi:cell division protein ZapA|uniref:cell division protein ZapA n=1 Tax=Sulfitobacter sp. CW3 TaxID=2861965 RepID=UPI001C5E27DB|nr:cell division protein ZapA [Sulfitobacter sp. CW3]MBW4963009.1 cell division protein ZapA [Sulfitobacter sp. CW3]